MRSKIAVLILAVAAGALLLLIARHQRLQADHQLAATRLRIIALDNELWALRARIASSVTPQHVSDLAQRLHNQLGSLQPVSKAPLAPEPKTQQTDPATDIQTPAPSRPARP